MKPDLIRDELIIRAGELGLTARALAERCADMPNADHINEYFTGRGQMTTKKASRLMTALGLSVTRTGPNVSLTAIGEPDDMTPDVDDKLPF